jgi:alpha-methylacyl-CoA racemase
MMLADMGADVVRIERSSAKSGEPPPRDPLMRNRRSIAVDLKHPSGAATVLRLIERADVLIEGFRPTVSDRLGLGPDICLARNPALVYGRMTGWGQSGPLAQSVGHDINYICLSGVLHLIGPVAGKPVLPLNLVGDFGGGGMLLGMGVLAAALEARLTGRGQVVDAAMIDGAVSLLGMFFGLRADGSFRDATGENFLAGAAPYYDTYQTKDGRYVAVGALEPQFFKSLLEKLELDKSRFDSIGFPALDDVTVRHRWPELRTAIAASFLRRTRDEWCQIFDGSNACFSPVLSVAEAERHPHNVERGTFIDIDGCIQNAPAPRFSRTPADTPKAPHPPGADTEAVLLESGFTPQEIEQLRAATVLT